MKKLLTTDFKPYAGSEPYIFASYSHLNINLVFPILNRLHEMGFNIWYDRGIDPGSEWPEEIAKHINHCSLFLLFSTKESMASNNVKREIQTSIQHNLKIINIYLEELELSPGLEMQLAPIQAIYNNYPDENDFYERLYQVINPVLHPASSQDSQTTEMLIIGKDSLPKKKRKFALLIIAVVFILGIVVIIQAVISKGLLNLPAIPQTTPDALPPGNTVAPIETTSASKQAANTDFETPGSSGKPSMFTFKDKKLVSFNPVYDATASYAIPDNITIIAEGAFKESVRSWDFDMSDSSITTIEKRAFYRCGGLKKVYFSNTLERIDSEAFSFCFLLSDVIFPDSLKYIGNSAFSNCYQMKSLIIPKNVISIDDYAFANCSDLTNVTIQSNTLSAVGLGAFGGCTSLLSVSLPEQMTELSKAMFHGCNSLVSISLPKSLITIREMAFIECDSLYAITIPENVEDLVGGTFAECSNLHSVVFRGTKLVNIGPATFQNCIALKTITLPNGLQTIGEQAFTGCSKLTAVHIPSSVIEIGEDIFNGAPSAVIYCTKDSEAQKYAQTNNIPFILE